MAACPAVDLISDANHQRQKQQLAAEHDQTVEECSLHSSQSGNQRQQRGRCHREHQNGNHHNYQQEAGAAARVQTGLHPDILDGQRKTCFITADSLMLCTVVGKDTLHLLHAGDQQHICHKNTHTDRAFHQIQHQIIRDPAIHKSADDTRQEEEQQNRHTQTQSHGNTRHQLLELLIPKLLF